MQWIRTNCTLWTQHIPNARSTVACSVCSATTVAWCCGLNVIHAYAVPCRILQYIIETHSITCWTCCSYSCGFEMITQYLSECGRFCNSCNYIYWFCNQLSLIICTRALYWNIYVSCQLVTRKARMVFNALLHACESTEKSHSKFVCQLRAYSVHILNFTYTCMRISLHSCRTSTKY